MKQAQTNPHSIVSTQSISSVNLRKFSMNLGFSLLLTVTGMLFISGCHQKSSMSTQFVVVHESKYPDIDQTCKAIKSELERRGFNCKGVLNLNNSMAKHGMSLERQVRVIQFGRATSAHAMLKDSPEASALIPCGFGVYEGENGRCYISRLNRRLIGKMLGGTIATVMGRQIAEDLNAVLRDHVREGCH